MKRISRVADRMLDRMVAKTTASAQLGTQWIECRFNPFCAVIGRDEKMSCRNSNGYIICESVGCC